MKARPILFKPDMVRAILDGRKTQTRRIVNGEHLGCLNAGLGANSETCPYGAPGDLLWVREAWGNGATRVMYKAGCNRMYRPPEGWKPSIHMPRWASRLTLEITDVRVERLQGISENDARAEGIADGGCLNCGEHEPCGCAEPKPDARDAFIHLWRSINGEESWSANPWVWVIQFQPHRMNVDAFLRDQEVA